MLRGRPRSAAQFATALDERLNPTAPGTAFPRGASEISSILTRNGAAGQRWNTAWHRSNLRIPGPVASGTIAAGQQEDRLVRRLSYASGALPTGTYAIVLVLNDRRIFSADVQVGP